MRAITGGHTGRRRPAHCAGLAPAWSGPLSGWARLPPAGIWGWAMRRWFGWPWMGIRRVAVPASIRLYPPARSKRSSKPGGKSIRRVAVPASIRLYPPARSKRSSKPGGKSIRRVAVPASIRLYPPARSKRSSKSGGKSIRRFAVPASIRLYPPARSKRSSKPGGKSIRRFAVPASIRQGQLVRSLAVSSIPDSGHLFRVVIAVFVQRYANTNMANRGVVAIAADYRSRAAVHICAVPAKTVMAQPAK